MGIDPLSSATRTAKRNLLLVSLAIITVKTFNVTIEQIPLANLSIKFDPGALGFLLTVSLLYFLLTFVLYFYIDVSNFEDTRHQQETSRLLMSGPDRFLQKLGDNIEDKLRNSLPDGVSIDGLTFPQELAKYVRPGQIVGIGMFRQMPFSLSHTVNERGLAFVRPLGREEGSKVYSRADRFLARKTWLLWWSLWLNRSYYRLRARSVRWTYAFRNYVVDFWMAVAVALYALLALLGYVDLEWLRQYSPVLKGAQ